MSSENQKKNIMYALGAGAVLIGAALLYKMMQSGDEESKDDKTQGGDNAQAVEDSDSDEMPEHEPIDETKIQEAIKKDNLEKHEGGQLNPQMFIRVLQLVGKCTKEHLKEPKDKLVKIRRDAYQKDDKEKYKQVVEQILKLEDQTATEILTVALGELNIDQQTFGMRHQELSQNPQTAEMVMAAQQGKLTAPDPTEQPKLSKAQTLKYLQKTQDLTIEQMRKAQTQQMTPPTNEQEQMEFMLEILVEQSRGQDKLWFENGQEFENEEFEAALMFYYQRDPETQRKMQEYMAMMQQAAGPMGGGAGMPMRR